MKPKICFLIPAYGSIPLPAWQSHINLVAMASTFCQPFVLTSSMCYIHECRNDLVRKFLKVDKEEKFDYAFWLDSDIVFNYKDVKALLDEMVEKDKVLASGLYFNDFTKPNGKKDFVPMVCDYDKKLDGYKIHAKEEKESLVVDSAGFGFVCMRSDVLKKLVEKFGRVFDYRTSKRGKMIGEDNLFFERARELGFGCWFVPSVRTGHAKTFVL